MERKCDPEFERGRLQQLCAECLHGEDITGEVIFRCTGEENQLDVATWFMSSEDFSLARESGFKTMLMRFIDDNVSARHQLGLPNSREGRVLISGSRATIEWLPDGDAERLIKQKRRPAAGID